MRYQQISKKKQLSQFDNCRKVRGMFDVSCNDLELIQVIIYLSKVSFAGSRCNSFSIPLPFLLKDFFRKPPGDSK